jgi:hypothetical protein
MGLERPLVLCGDIRPGLDQPPWRCGEGDLEDIVKSAGVPGMVARWSAAPLTALPDVDADFSRVVELSCSVKPTEDRRRRWATLGLREGEVATMRDDAVSRLARRTRCSYLQADRGLS